MTTNQMITESARIREDHNEHVYAFRNAPLSQRKAYVRAELVKSQARYDETMAKGNFGHPDNYYNWKTRHLTLQAALVDKPLHKHAPMYYWHGGMSN